MATNHLLSLSKDERNAVEELRSRVKNMVSSDVYEDDHHFIRFLKARNMNLDDAEALIYKCLEWRRKYQVDTIKTDYKMPEVLEKYYAAGIIGYDKEGCPVRYVAHGETDYIGFWKSVKHQEYVKYMFNLMEEEVDLKVQQSLKLGKIVKGSVVIVDLQKLDFIAATNKKTIENFMLFFKMHQDCYPESLKKIYMINVSKYFALWFEIVKTVLATSFVDKMMFCGDDWKSVLLDEIGADNLPAFLGGTKTDPDGDPMCNTFVNHGGKIPSSYYISKPNLRPSNESSATRLAVARASFAEIEVAVREAESLIEWEFESKSGDIGFGLFLREAEDGRKNVELVPLLRLEADQFLEEGLYKCKTPGTYVILFDNSYSLVRSKEIFYRLQVVTPKEAEEKLCTE